MSEDEQRWEDGYEKPDEPEQQQPRSSQNQQKPPARDEEAARARPLPSKWILLQGSSSSLISLF